MNLMLAWGTNFYLSWEDFTYFLGRNGTNTRDRLYRSRIVQPNGSYFGWTYLFNSSSNLLKTSNLFERVGLWGLFALFGRDRLVRLFSIWFTWHFGLLGQFIAICPGPPQYKHRRFAQRLCFSSSDNGPCLCVASISIGVGTSIGVILDDCLESGLAATDA